METKIKRKKTVIFTQKNLFVDKENSGHVFPLLAGSDILKRMQQKQEQKNKKKKGYHTQCSTRLINTA